MQILLLNVQIPLIIDSQKLDDLKVKYQAQIDEYKVSE